MCGITGIFDTRNRSEINQGLLRRMTDSVAHRGPDGDGFHVGPGIGLGHRRLAIIDLVSGDQPIYNEDGSVGIVFNGEIYNFQALMAELEALGHRFSTRSDTETIVHAWEEWGEACVERLRGMFAFALWDEKAQTLFLARDRLGKKPLYYALLPNGFLVFGSELKSLLVHPNLPRELDASAVEDYFAYGYVPDPKVIYRGVHKLPPASTLCLRRGNGAVLPSPKTYWRVRFDDSAGNDEAALCADLIDRLRQAVDIRRISDVPIGAFLSGGVDSSAVVALMSGLSPEAVNTFSISFKQREFDESAYATAHAERYGTRHFVRQVDADEFDLVDQLATIYDEPFGDSSAIPTYRVSAIAREQVTVALSGDGGDEFLAGYRRYPWHLAEERVRRAMPAGLRRSLFGLLGRAYPKLDWAPRRLRAKSTFQELALDTVPGYFASVSKLNDQMRDRLYSDGFKRRLDGYHAVEVLQAEFASADTDDPLLQAQHADIKTWLAGGILVKVDRASMANSLETRAPMLDHEFVEWTATLPPALKLNRRGGKYLFKRALEPHVSADILYRPKMGFSVPLAKWFRGPLRQRLRDAVSSSALRETDIFDMRYLSTLADQHIAGRRDHSAALWSVLMFESFLRQVHGAGHSALGDEARTASVG